LAAKQPRISGDKTNEILEAFGFKDDEKELF
jgi:hypothetical protein